MLIIPLFDSITSTDGWMDQWTDGPTDGQTVKASYRVAIHEFKTSNMNHVNSLARQEDMITLAADQNGTQEGSFALRPSR